MILDARFSAERLGCERVHSHNYSVVAAVESGTINMSIAGQTMEWAKGAIYFIPAGLAHRILSVSQDFSGVHVLSLSCSISAPLRGEDAGGILVRDPKRYLEFLELMRRYYKADGGERQTIARSILLFFEECDVHLSSTGEGKPLSPTHWVPSRIKDLIDNGADKEGCFQFIEEHMPFSKEHCNRLFKKCYGTTIQAYALNTRAERARLLLKSGRPLSESAAEAGFYDQSQLTKTFRSIFQMTPAKYRKQNF
ncbi:helix-turn-helix domain-containing protein [Puniceicoccus vermicola]|uniref:AraC family transcriptional regulator n=2 Tax=Puniceicoccus vermicola TaxID=388746 RepID=A0A7X1AYF5_9BACT|nr:AraC family transcriptional regulator [Puniceicoccus vermicola]